MADRTQKPRVDNGPNQTLICIFMGTYLRGGNAVICLWQDKVAPHSSDAPMAVKPLPVGSGSPTQLRAQNPRVSDRQGGMLP